jgi:NhaA family Na+:H+ antiporter
MNKTNPQRAVESLREFLQLESAGGLVLIGATVIALIVANIPASQGLYASFLQTHLTITVGGMGIDKPILLWINDALMALFFMLVGLELKREIMEGQLSRPDQIVLPAMAALGGIIFPAGIYWVMNGGSEINQNGWAIPTATDIAFALAILGLLGSRVPVALKVFLTTIAVFDDIAAVVMIAAFYTSDLSTNALMLAAAGMIGLFILNRFKVVRLAPYMLIGFFLWFCVLKSGVHATLAGVMIAAFIPMRSNDNHSPAKHLEHTLHPWVAFAILPLFAFANAGISFSGFRLGDVVEGVPMGIILGLFLGKQLGVMGMVGVAHLFKLAVLPAGTNWGQVYGVSILCGVGFTMSLFIGTLAFEHGNFDMLYGVKLGVIVGSILAAAWGLIVLHMALPKNRP